MKLKNTVLLIAAVFATLTTFAQFEPSKQVYSSPKLSTEIYKHKIVAILPFKTTFTYKRLPKNYDAEANRAEEQKLAANMQQGMYTYLLRKANKYTVSFQDVERTNALLKQSGIYDNMDVVTQDSICKVLGVDAVVKCAYDYERTAGDAGAIAKGVLLGAAFSKTGAGALTMQIYNGKDGDLLWRFYKQMNEDVLGPANQVMERMMRKVARNFPYEID